MWLENDDAARVEHAATLEAASRRGGTHSTAGDAWDGCIVELLRARVSAAIFQLGHGGECADTLSPVEPLSSVVLPALTLVRGGALHAVRGECAVTRTHRFMADGLFLEPEQAHDWHTVRPSSSSYDRRLTRGPPLPHRRRQRQVLTLLRTSMLSCC